MDSDPNERVPGDSHELDQSGKNSMPSAQEEEEAIRKKYGGMLPKKQPLISKDNERAFFDSADWALGKQGAPVEKAKGPLEALRPKLQPTPQQQMRTRRSSYASLDIEGIAMRTRRSSYASLDIEDVGNGASDDANKESQPI